MNVMSAFNMSRHLTLTRRSEKPFLMESVLIVQYNTIQYNQLNSIQYFVDLFGENHLFR